MVMARLHIICGNCGSNDMFSFRVDANGNCGEDGTEYPSVRVFCGNCATLHPLGNTIKEDKHTYSDICAALTAANKERDEAKRSLAEWENAILLNDSLRKRAETAERLWMEERSKCDSKIKEAQESQRQIATAREENERHTAENANLSAATRGKTFFHSDEEVNAELGRLRAKVAELSLNPLDKVIRALIAHGYSCEESADILADYLHRREKRKHAQALEESK